MYNTTKKVQLQKNTFIDAWLQENGKTTKYLSVLIFFIALIISTLFFGTTNGILFWLFTISIILSLIIVLYPLKLVKKKHFKILCLSALCIETILNL